MEVTGPILSERTSRYKRNSLVLSVAAILAAMIPGASIDKAKIFELTLGPDIWWIGAAILIYNLFWLAVLSRQDFVAWDREATIAGFRKIYGEYFTIVGFRISQAFHPRNFWSAITCRVSAEAKADKSIGGGQKIASFRCAAQYLTFVIFEILLTGLLASFALTIAVFKTCASIAASASILPSHAQFY